MAVPTLRPTTTPPGGGRVASNGSNPGNQQQVATQASLVPFTRASRYKTILGFNTGNITLGTGAIAFSPQQIPPAGFLKWVDLQVIVTSAGNSAAVAYAADSPWNAIQQISVTNSAGDSIIVPLSGYNLYLMNKWGLLAEDAPWSDPRRDPFYTAGATGTGATAGSFTFSLRVPFEVDQRDAFCSLPNMAANRAYTINLVFNGTAAIYTTAPTALPTINVVGICHYWSQPNDSNSAGVGQATEPMGNGSVSLWRYQTAPVTPGDRLTQIQNVGNVLRNIIFILRTSAGARTAADWSAVTQIKLNNDTLFYLPTWQWQADMANYYGYDTGALDAAGGLDTGVFVLPYLNSLRGTAASDGPRDQWLPTLDATLLQIQNTSFGASANTLEVVTNEIKPISAAALYAPNVS